MSGPFRADGRPSYGPAHHSHTPHPSGVPSQGYLAFPTSVQYAPQPRPGSAVAAASPPARSSGGSSGRHRTHSDPVFSADVPSSGFYTPHHFHHHHHHHHLHRHHRYHHHPSPTAGRPIPRMDDGEDLLDTPYATTGVELTMGASLAARAVSATTTAEAMWGARLQTARTRMEGDEVERHHLWTHGSHGSADHNRDDDDCAEGFVDEHDESSCEEGTSAILEMGGGFEGDEGDVTLAAREAGHARYPAERAIAAAEIELDDEEGDAQEDQEGVEGEEEEGDEDEQEEEDFLEVLSLDALAERIKQTRRIDVGLGSGGAAAVWTVSSAKHNCGVAHLLDWRNSTTYWQSDGALPHTASVCFQRLTAVECVCVLLCFSEDESYTPKAISVLAGTHDGDVAEVVAGRAVTPHGWVILDIGGSRKQMPTHVGVDGEDEEVGRVWCTRLQVVFAENHENGRDCHVRGIRILGPTNSSTLPDPDFTQHLSLR